MKKIIIILFLLICLPSHIFADELIDVDDDGIMEKIIISDQGNQHALAVFKSGKNIFPKNFPSCYPFIIKNDLTKTRFRSKGGYFIDKSNYENQIIIFQQKDTCLNQQLDYLWPEDFVDRTQGRTEKIICGWFFKYNHRKDMFVFYRQDCIKFDLKSEPTQNDIKMLFRCKSPFTKAFEKACYFLGLMKQSRFDDAKTLCLGDVESERYIEKIQKNNNQQYLMEINLTTWQSYISPYGYHFFAEDGKNPYFKDKKTHFVIKIDKDLKKITFWPKCSQVLY